jgi:riboflavin kinase/FMN adenylyltransferase
MQRGVYTDFSQARPQRLTLNMITAIIKEISSLAPKRGTLVSIGVFDGMHLGHRTLIRELVDQATAKKLLSAVVTFRRHPMALLAPGESVPWLTSLTERTRLIKEQGVDIIITLTFSHQLAELGAQPFVLLLQQYLKMQGMILGWDFALGRHREGSLEALHELGIKLGFTTVVVGPVKYKGEIISSTAIRQALSNGDMVKANAMLGRPFSLEGSVIAGEGRGKELGLPTANLDLDPHQALPSDGVYATIAYFEGQTYPAATFIGHRPTFSGVERIVEVHVLDYTGDLYRRNLKIDIIERLRGEQKFPGAEALKAQIVQDIVAIRQRLSQTL